MLTTLAAYRLVASDLDRSLARTAAQPVVERASEDYLARIGDIKSIDDFMADDRVYRYAMKAFGLEDMTFAKAFIRKLLEEGTQARDAMANRLSDRRYREFAQNFDFNRFGSATTAFSRVQQGVVDRYLRMTLEATEGAQNEGVRLALYFRRKASGINGPFDVLADPALLRVAQVATGISSATSAADIDKQASLIADRLNFEDFKDPEKLESFLQRFATLYEIERGPANSPAATLIGGSPQLGLSVNVLTAMQSFRIGGR